MSILGNRVLRREDPKFLTVGGTYVADLDLPGSVHLMFVRSSMAHAKIVSLDTSQAKAMPGVIGRILAGTADASEQASFRALWQDRVRRLMIEHADDPRLITVSGWPG